MKLVDEPDTRSWLDKLSIPDEVWKRRQHYVRMKKRFCNAYDALDSEEFDEWLSCHDFTAQDINEMCDLLWREIREVDYFNRKSINFLRKMKPKRLWTGKL